MEADPEGTGTKDGIDDADGDEEPEGGLADECCKVYTFAVKVDDLRAKVGKMCEKRCSESPRGVRNLKICCSISRNQTLFLPVCGKFRNFEFRSKVLSLG